MKIGIGLPAIPGTSGKMLLDWAKQADQGPFSSLAMIDRIVYGNFEPMTALAAAAGATERIRLMTTILLAPTRNGGILAKQAASLDAISGGRLTLGMGSRRSSRSALLRGPNAETRVTRPLPNPPPSGEREQAVDG